MCFSPEADAASAVVLAPVAVAALRAARSPRELPLAALPALLAGHQLVSAVVWLGLRGEVGAGALDAATTAYLIVAQALLPVLVPVAVALCEPHARRRGGMLALGAVGLAVGAYLLMTIVARPIGVAASDHAIVYTSQTGEDWLIALAYVAATCGAPLLSSRPLVRVLGAVNVVGFAVAGLVRHEAVTSIWCTYAALASVLVWLALRPAAPPRRAAGEPEALSAARRAAAARRGPSSPRRRAARRRARATR